MSTDTMEFIEIHENAEIVKYSALGAAGGVASGLPSLKTLSYWQLVGCGISGGFVGPLVTNLIPLAWKGAPSELLYFASFFIGTGATVILAIFTAWWQMVQRKHFFERLMANKFGTPTDDPPTPIPPTKGEDNRTPLR